MHYPSRWLLLAMLGLAPRAHATTLPDAITGWTGVVTDVEGKGERVRIELPPRSQVRTLTARARATTQNGEPGWRLTEVAIPVPAHLSGGGRATIASQQAGGWLGDRTADGAASFAGIAIDKNGSVTRLDHAQIGVTAADGPVQLAVDLAGLHVSAAAANDAPLLPRHVVVRGHTTRAGAAALAAMTNGQPAAAAPITLDAVSFDLGPANFTGSGHVTLLSPTDRHGRVTLEATGFQDLMQAIPLDSHLLRLYPAMMVLRQMAHKQNGRLVWTADFDGDRILMNGLDIAPLLGG